MATATAYIGLATRAKMFGQAAGDPYIPAYRLEGVSDEAHLACEDAWLWSNGVGTGAVLYRGQRHAEDPPLYDGPSLSVGDVVCHANDAGESTWWVCAMAGFEPCRVIHPVPVDDAEIAIDGPRHRQRAASWARWLDLAERTAGAG